MRKSLFVGPSLLAIAIIVWGFQRRKMPTAPVDFCDFDVPSISLSLQNEIIDGALFL